MRSVRTVSFTKTVSYAYNRKCIPLSSWEELLKLTFYFYSLLHLLQADMMSLFTEVRAGKHFVSKNLYLKLHYDNYLFFSWRQNKIWPIRITNLKFSLTNKDRLDRYMLWHEINVAQESWEKKTIKHNSNAWFGNQTEMKSGQ